MVSSWVISERDFFTKGMTVKCHLFKWFIIQFGEHGIHFWDPVFRFEDFSGGSIPDWNPQQP